MKSMVRLVLTAQFTMCIAAPVGIAHADDAAPSRDPGVWQRHEMRINSMSFTSTYSCDGLADKLKRLLIVAGARQDVKSNPSGCAEFGRPDKLAAANLVFYTLAVPDAGVAAAKIVGTWRPVTFAARTPRELELGDCELIEQFRDQLLPLFRSRNIDDHTTCIPHQLSGSNIDLKFEAFVPFPDKPTGNQHTHPTAMN